MSKLVQDILAYSKEENYEGILESTNNVNQETFDEYPDILRCRVRCDSTTFVTREALTLTLISGTLTLTLISITLISITLTLEKPQSAYQLA